MSETLDQKEARVRELIASGDIHTYADGFGLWCAAVRPTYAHPMGVAKLAIRIECRDRNPSDYADRMPAVESVGRDSMGRTIYRERADQ